MSVSNPGLLEEGRAAVVHVDDVGGDGVQARELQLHEHVDPALTRTNVMPGCERQTERQTERQRKRQREREKETERERERDRGICNEREAHTKKVAYRSEKGGRFASRTVPLRL
jgi:hypothetical protein